MRRAFSAMNCNIVAPTFLELGGASADITIDGRSLVPLIDDSAIPWRNAALIDVHWYSGIRTKDYVYVSLDSGGKELYDLKIDRNQMNNLAFMAPWNEKVAALEGWKNEFKACAGVTCHIAEDKNLQLPVPDTTAPDTSIDSLFDGDGNSLTVVNGQIVNTPVVTFGFSGTDNVAVAGFECAIDGLAFSACSSPQTFSGLAEGDHLLAVRAVDSSGNIDPSPAELTIEVRLPDTTAPNTAIDSLADGNGNSLPVVDNQAVTTDSVSLGFSGIDDKSVVGFECSIDSVLEESFVLCTSPHVFGGLAEGEHFLVVRAIDAAGNKDLEPARITIVIELEDESPV